MEGPPPHTSAWGPSLWRILSWRSDERFKSQRWGCHPAAEAGLVTHGTETPRTRLVLTPARVLQGRQRSRALRRERVHQATG